MKLVIIVILTGILFSAICLAQYPDTLWTYELLSQCYGSPACADIDNDGYLEIVFGTYFDDEHAYALNAEDGSLLWRFDVGGGPLDAAPVIADLDSDDTLEIIIPASWGIIFCLNPAGEIKWRYPSTGYIECIDSPPSVADIDGDGKLEVIFGAWYGKLYVLDGADGSLVWQKTYCDTGYIQSAPCILDCDGDGELDIAFGMYGGDCKVYAVSGSDGDTLWTFQADDRMYSGPATADIDLDGTPELVIGDYSGKVYALDAQDGSLIWQNELAYYIFPPVTIAELVPDSLGPEILCAETDLFCLSANGEIIWTYHTGNLIDRGAVVAEIDGDDNLEVIFGSSDGNLYVLDGENGNLVWQFTTGEDYPIENAPIVADFDNDGNVDIFFIGGRGYSDTIPNYGRAYAITAGPGDGEIWTMYRHDRYRTGYLMGGPSAIEPEQANTPANIDIEIEPNPFNQNCKISISEPNPDNQSRRINIFDLSGKLIYQKSGIGSKIIWTPERTIGSGLYIVQIAGDNFSLFTKVVFIR
ncbi:hypothetical protein DRQ33_08755 [bacterium]|nr:MAG: hypothetical protein DRQ33_08755 [bacterium]